MRRFGLLLFACGFPWVSTAQLLHLPTANQAIFEKNGAERYFAPVAGRTWESGTFGCVRSDGYQVHEGIDILPMRRDKRGEPIDPVISVADGVIAYVNRHASLSNYGNYIVIQHFMDGLEIYTLYAHLKECRKGLVPGNRVKTGETIGILGRTANTRQSITIDRAHLHFEVNLLINERFSAWHKKNQPGERNDHGIWNGQNMLGLDPRLIFLQEARMGTNFSLLNFTRSQTELCRILIRKTEFPWIKRYAPLIQQNPIGKGSVLAGYEVSLNFNGIPFRIIPRSNAELRNLTGKSPYVLLAVNEEEQRKNPGRKLLIQKSSHWELSNNGERLMSLLLY